jgi:MFS family permease
MTSMPERCAQHVDRFSSVTCRRCGTFCCAACHSEEFPTHCRECAERLARGKRVGQVPMLGIVMMIHGTLMVGSGIYAVSFGGLFAQSFAERAPTDGSGDGELGGIFLGASMLFGIALLVPGVLQVLSGWKARTYRGRSFAIAALVSGLVGSIFCYCAPSSIALLIWGLVVLLGEDVAARFAVTRPSAT